MWSFLIFWVCIVGATSRDENFRTKLSKLSQDVGTSEEKLFKRFIFGLSLDQDNYQRLQNFYMLLPYTKGSVICTVFLEGYSM